MHSIDDDFNFGLHEEITEDQLANLRKKDSENLEKADSDTLDNWWSVAMALVWLIYRDKRRVAQHVNTYRYDQMDGLQWTMPDVERGVVYDQIALEYDCEVSYQDAVEALRKRVFRSGEEIRVLARKVTNQDRELLSPENRYRLDFDDIRGDFINIEDGETNFVEVTLNAEDLQAIWPSSSESAPSSATYPRRQDQRKCEEHARNWLIERAQQGERPTRKMFEKEMLRLFGMKSPMARSIWSERRPIEWGKRGRHGR